MRDGLADPGETEAYARQYIEITTVKPARQTKLAHPAALGHLAAERSFAFDVTAMLVVAAYRQLQ